jgi:hypothetical protein
MTTTDMDALAYNWGLTRLTGTKATGYVTFAAVTKPTSPITISTGTTIKTQAVGGTIYRFSTTATATLQITATPNPKTSFYEVSAPVIAEDIGSAYNVSSNTITVFETVIQGIDYVRNDEGISGGTDNETNESLASRVLIKVSGSNIGTKDGYKSLILQNFPSILDVSVVGPNDSEMVRTTIYGGAVDIYGITINMDSTSDTFTYDGSSLYPTIRPVLNILTVQGITMSGGSLYNFVSGTDYQFTKDISGFYGFSSRSYDRIDWLIRFTPILGSSVVVNYTYDKDVVDAQAFLDLPVNQLVASDPLMKYGTKVLVDIELQVNKLSGYDPDTIKTNIQTAVSNKLASMKLGEVLQYSDIVNIAADIDGVDEVVIPLRKFYKTLDPKPDFTIQNITPKLAEYIRLGVLTVTVN